MERFLCLCNINVMGEECYSFKVSLCTTMRLPCFQIKETVTARYKTLLALLAQSLFFSYSQSLNTMLAKLNTA